MTSPVSGLEGERPTVLRELAAGSMTWITCVALALSSSALIFGGDLAPLVPYGITGALIAYAASTLVVTLFGSFRFGIGGPDSPSSAVLGTMVSAIGLDLVHAGSGAPVPTVMFAVTLSGIVLGGCFIAIGALRGSRWARHIPYPVTAGFLATAGWYVCSGAARVVTGHSLTYANLHFFASADVLERVAVTLAWGGIMIVVQRRWHSPLVLPALLACGIGAFYLVLAAGSIPISSAHERAWLFSVPSRTEWWFPWTAGSLALIDPGILVRHVLDILAILVIATISLFSYESALELETEQEPDIDRELRVNGAAVLAGACSGGIIAYLSLGRTSMNYRLGARGRLSAFVIVALSLALLAGGLGVISDVPEFVVGGLLLQTGLPLLWSSAIATRSKLSPADYLTVIVIWQINVWLGFVFGFTAGLLICCVIFAVRYASVSSVKTVGDGRTMRSQLQRPGHELAILNRDGKDVAVFVLQGYLFFGTADRLHEITKTVGATHAPPRFLVFDFRFISGIDSSAVSTFAKIRRAAADRGMTLVLSGMRPPLDGLWFAEKVHSTGTVRTFPDLDRALEWCESELISGAQSAARAAKTLVEWLADGLAVPEDAARIEPYLTTRVLAKGEVLCRQGDPADTIFYVRCGRLGVFSGDMSHRLRSLGSETVVGEMGFYRDLPRSATLIAEEHTEVQELSRAMLERVEAEAPNVAIAFHRVIIRVVADRLAFENELITLLNQ
jgi:sulfate permease, SulP family